MGLKSPSLCRMHLPAVRYAGGLRVFREREVTYWERFLDRRFVAFLDRQDYRIR
jgi:hypothetical protein